MTSLGAFVLLVQTTKTRQLFEWPSTGKPWLQRNLNFYLYHLRQIPQIRQHEWPLQILYLSLNVEQMGAINKFPRDRSQHAKPAHDHRLDSNTMLSCTLPWPSNISTFYHNRTIKWSDCLKATHLPLACLCLEPLSLKSKLFIQTSSESSL